MHKVSRAYKEAMKQPLREVGYIQIGLGAISLEAQGTASVESGNTFAYWSDDTTLFSDYTQLDDYATMEQNFFKADGSMNFVPEESPYSQFNNVGVATRDLFGDVKISFADAYAIKGLTIDFGENYPTAFTVTTDNGTVHTFANNTQTFLTTDVIGLLVKSITIHPISFKGGQGRLRIKHALMGVGLNFSNADVADSNFNEFVSAISKEVSSASFSADILDPNDRFNVDDQSSFINFLKIGQRVEVKGGQTLADGTIEWLTIATLLLNEWSSERGKFTFSAVDRFANASGDYELGNNISTRTAYSEAVSILTDMGLDVTEYDVDYYLQNITLTNPMPKANHKECLQLLCNACRCVCYQDYDGRIVIRPNFALVIEPEDITVTTDSEAAWSKPTNVIAGSEAIYADMTKNFFSADGSQNFLPENGEAYLETGYVTELVADGDGAFLTTPSITYAFDAGYTYYGFYIGFDGNPPIQMRIKTYLSNTLVETKVFTNLENENYIFEEFDRFDTAVFEFVVASEHDRVLVNKISFGDYNDYNLSNMEMTDTLYGTRERTVKAVKVKVFSYTQNPGEEPKQTDDDVWYTYPMNTVGDVIEVENELIGSMEQAQTVAEWLANYYTNNVVYDAEYRGDPRLNANDIIHVQSEVLSSLQVAIETNDLTFNGAWHGNLTMRRALKITQQ